MFDSLKLERSTSSQATLNTAWLWYRSCHDGHNVCNHSAWQKRDWLPTRILDIGKCQDSQWKLIVTSEAATILPKSLYMTLSYRWGDQPSLTLLSTTLDEFRGGLPISSLPQTFQDAIIVARRFSVQYLWIDALCIIQDSREDRDREIATMHDVYANSACNLAASASDGPNGGLFRIRNEESIAPGIITAPSLAQNRSDYYIFDKAYWNSHILNGPLHRRGWVFQERLLAPRVLYFGSAQVLWECYSEVKCEGFPYGIPYHASIKNLDPIWNMPVIKPHSTNEDIKMPDTLHSLWLDLVRDYSSCNFTKITDKLPAFSGIARAFQEVTGDEYVAGLWKSRLCEQLDWWVDKPCLKISSQYRAPTWSWAAVDGPVRPRRLPADTRFLISNLVPIIQNPANAPLHIISLELTGSLTISTKLKRPIRAILYPDSLEIAIGRVNPFYFLPILTYQLEPPSGSSSGTEISCILLEAMLCTMPVKFRRIGHCVMNDEDDIRALGLHNGESIFVDSLEPHPPVDFSIL
jgi:hypothetical protein